MYGWDPKYKWWEKRIKEFISALKSERVDEKFIPQVLSLMDEDYRADIARLQAKIESLDRKLRKEDGHQWLSKMQQSLLITTVRQILGAYDIPLRVLSQYTRTGEIDQATASLTLSLTMVMFESNNIPLPPVLQEFKDAGEGRIHAAGDDDVEEGQPGAGDEEPGSSQPGGQARKQTVEA